MEFPLKGKVIFFATGNVHKFREAKEVLSRYGIALGMLRIKSLEIQSESLEEIAETSVLDAFKKCGLPMIVEDAGLFVEALNGFPGPFSSYVYQKIGNSGLLKLMEGVENRQAKFRSALAYLSKELESPKCFVGEVRGEITRENRGGPSGFGFDPIFKPEKCEKTFAEMTLMEKNRYSHRAKAFRKFAKWYKNLSRQ